MIPYISKSSSGMLLVFADNMSLLLSDLVVAFDKGSEKNGTEKSKLGDVPLG
jgi:hypothetical protein